MNQLTDFDRLIMYATTNNWCWRLGCTTCGCTGFHNGMELISTGLDPLGDVSRLSVDRVPGAEDFAQRSARNTRLGAQAISAEIELYAETFEVPYWIGFLGLTLNRLFAPVPINVGTNYLETAQMRGIYLVKELVSNVWAQKFLEIFKTLEPSRKNAVARSDAVSICKLILKGERQELRIADLGKFHAALSISR